jgi:Holin of 3TMs, for gene-transfer release
MAEEVKSASEQKKEDWMNSKWRPMMGWMYMLICTMDMVIFPVLWSLLQAFTHTAITQWNPLTLQGAGLFHIAMGAVLGIAAFGRTQEKLNGANNGGAQTPATGFASGPSAPSVPSAGFGAPAGGFGAPTTAPSSFSGSGFGGTPPATGGFGAPVTTPSFTAKPTTVMSSSGKPGPVQPEQPEI